MNSGEGKGVWVEMGEVKGAIPAKIGVINVLLLVTDKAILVILPKTSLLKSLIMPRGLPRLMEARALVKLAKMKLEEMVQKLSDEKEKFRMISFIKRDLIKYIEFKRKFFGLGLVAFTVYTIDGKKVEFTLIYGKGTGWDKDEAVNHAIKLLKVLNVRIEKKF